MTGADADHEEVTHPTGVNGEVFGELMSTGAVVAGRGTFEPAGGWRGDHHDGVPIFILYRQEPGIDIEQWSLVTRVNDITSAMALAKQAAGEKNVLVHGAGVAQLALAAGVLDELELHVIPVFLGQGRRLFDGLGPEHIELERTRIIEGKRAVSPTCTTGSGAEVRFPRPLVAGLWVSVSAASIVVVFSGAVRLGELRSRACRCSHGHRPSGCDTGATGRRVTLPQRHRRGVGGSLTRTPLRRAYRFQRPCSLPIVRAYLGSA